jgi:hypothetical protein
MYIPIQQNSSKVLKYYITYTSNCKPSLESTEERMLWKWMASQVTLSCLRNIINQYIIPIYHPRFHIVFSPISTILISGAAYDIYVIEDVSVSVLRFDLYTCLYLLFQLPTIISFHSVAGIWGCSWTWMRTYVYVCSVRKKRGIS